MTQKVCDRYCRAGRNSPDAVDVIKRRAVQIQDSASAMWLFSQSSQANIGMLIYLGYDRFYRRPSQVTIPESPFR
jgi:hypothetical protein